MRFRSSLAAGALIAALGAGTAGCSLFNSGPATVQTKYQCTQVVNGKKQQAYCIQDSNGNNFYVSYYTWRRIVIGQDETRYARASYWSDTSHEPADSDVPVSEHAGTHASDGGDFGGDGGGHGDGGGGDGGGGR